MFDVIPGPDRKFRMHGGWSRSPDQTIKVRPEHKGSAVAESYCTKLKYSTKSLKDPLPAPLRFIVRKMFFALESNRHLVRELAGIRPRSS
jgi:hypothetical protein